MKRKFLSLLTGIGFAAFVSGPPPALAATAPSLGTASNFAALGGAGVTCTSPFPPLSDAITVTGDVGSFIAAHSSVTGFPGFTPGANRCSLLGTVQLGATQAFADLNTAYDTLDTLPGNSCPADVSLYIGPSLDGLPPLSPGVYCIRGVGTLTSQLTLNGPSGGIWIFKGESITPINGSVVMTGGGQACNVYWKLGTTAVFDGNTHFVGNVLAGTAISFTGVGSSLVGRALAITASVTMTGANISLGNCGGTPPPPPSCDKPDKQNCDGDHHGDQDQDDNDDDDGHGHGHGRGDHGG